MRITKGFIPGVLALTMCLACGKAELDGSGGRGGQAFEILASAPVSETGKPRADFEAVEAVDGEEREKLLLALENIAELERFGAFTQGLGLRESLIREQLGDTAGAVAAAYKELAWAYGRGLVEKNALEQGLGNALALDDIPARAAKGLLDFVHGQWAEADSALRSLSTGAADEEPDSFIRWMILSCALELDRNDRQSASAYKAIRARYNTFPEYWYRGARVFSGTIAAEYAERCIVLAPDGPFAGECRAILASSVGLNPQDGSALRSRPEIEGLVSLSVNQGEPAALAPLMPLIALPDNAYTVYAVGALRALAAVPKFGNYFRELAALSSGRLAERLAYICQAAL